MLKDLVEIFKESEERLILIGGREKHMFYPSEPHRERDLEEEFEYDLENGVIDLSDYPRYRPNPSISFH